MQTSHETKWGTTESVSTEFDYIERGYIAEKLGSWKSTDLARLEDHLSDYVRTGSPFYLNEFQNQLKWLSDPTSNLQRELTYIEDRRQNQNREVA